MQAKGLSSGGYRATEISQRFVDVIPLHEAIAAAKPRVAAQPLLEAIHAGDYYVVTETLEAKSLRASKDPSSNFSTNGEMDGGVAGRQGAGRRKYE